VDTHALHMNRSGSAPTLVVSFIDIRSFAAHFHAFPFPMQQAETRTAVVETVEIILRRLPEAHRRQFSTFASLFSRSAKVSG